MELGDTIRMKVSFLDKSDVRLGSLESIQQLSPQMLS